jgi:hypothetical protein
VGAPNPTIGQLARTIWSPPGDRGGQSRPPGSVAGVCTPPHITRAIEKLIDDLECRKLILAEARYDKGWSHSTKVPTEPSEAFVRCSTPPPSAAVWHATGNAMPSSRPIGFPTWCPSRALWRCRVDPHEKEQESDAALVQPERQPGGLCFCNTKPS